MLRLRKPSESILAVFFVSGFTGLIYESVWSHYVKLFLGHAAYAQTLVLVVFIGGLALGAWLCARLAPRLANPLRLYALVEGAIGLIALVFHPLFVAATDWGYATLLPATCNAGTPVCATQWALAALLLAPQSVLLGATFPLVTSAALRRDASEPGHDIAALYFLNTFGAVLGVLASAFVLIPGVGLPGTLVAAGAANMLIAAVAWWLSRVVPPPLAQLAEPAANAETPLPDRSLARLLLVTAFLTGLSSFVYEIVWIRMLGLVLGASTHSFEIMLASFLLGLALGGGWIRKRLDGSDQPVRLLGRVQLVMGLSALATLPLYSAAFDAMAWILGSLARNDAGFLLFNVSSTLIALVVMLPATFCAGMTLPIITYRLLRSPRGEKALGTVYAVNTLGSILGVVIAVHVLLQWLGLRGALVVGAAVDVVLGVLLLASLRRGRARYFVPEAIAGLAALALMGAFLELDVRRLASGVFRGGVARIHADQSVLFHRDGKTATVDVIDGRGSRSIRTNGKSDAAIATGTRPILDEYTMALLAILPLGHMPDARDAAVIGFGSGMSSAVLLASPTIARVDTIEIEPAMVEGAKHFRPVVDAAFDDPRSHIVIDDAKSFFARGGRKYDIVVSEPSNPWVSGVASLFTEEFYARMATYLNEGGIVAQWLHTYEMDAPTLAAIVAAASKSFPDFVIYSSVDSDVILIARKGGAPGTFDERVLAFPRLQPLLERLAMRDPEIIRRRAIADAKALLPFLRTYGMPSNSDYRPVVDHRASRTRFTKAQVRELNDLQALPVPVLEMIGAARVPSRERHENHGATFIDMATNDAWLLRDAIVGDRRWSAPDGLTPRRASAHLLREWGACRTSLGFEDMLPALVDVAEVVNTRLHPAVSAQVWQSLGASPCAKALAPAQRRWLTLLDAIGRRDARVMAEQAQAIIDASHAARPPSEALDTAFFAGVTGLACSGRREAARAFLERGMGDASQPLPARQSAVRLFDAITRDPMPACREAT